MENNYKTLNHYKFACRYHIIFCPKYRRKILTDGIDTRLKELIGEYCKKKNIDILGMEVMPDHVHLLLDCPLDMSPINVVKGIKQQSAIKLKKEFPTINRRLPNLWTRSAFVCTVGSISLDVVKKYIEEQK